MIYCLFLYYSWLSKIDEIRNLYLRCVIASARNCNLKIYKDLDHQTSAFVGYYKKLKPEDVHVGKGENFGRPEFWSSITKFLRASPSQILLLLKLASETP